MIKKWILQLQLQERACCKVSVLVSGTKPGYSLAAKSATIDTTRRFTFVSSALLSRLILEDTQSICETANIRLFWKKCVYFRQTWNVLAHNLRIKNYQNSWETAYENSCCYVIICYEAKHLKLLSLPFWNFYGGSHVALRKTCCFGPLGWRFNGLITSLSLLSTITGSSHVSETTEDLVYNLP